MKNRLLLFFIVAVAAISAKADINGDGYYRVHNYDTDRYIYVYDNRGSLNLASSTIDLNALELWSGIDRAISDPGSVIYFEQHGNKYDLKAQGTGVYQMIETYVNIRKDNKIPHTYWAYGEKSGIVKYLCDAIPDPYEESSWLVGEGTFQRNWYITPIDANTDNYFGVKPKVFANGHHYGTLYADFPFSFASSGLTAYYVKKYDTKRGLAIWAAIENGKVPANTPVIIKCASADKSGNRLNLGTSGASAINDNILKGVYFNYNAVKAHTNQTKYDKNKMRVLGVTADGSIGLITADIQYIDANSLYMPVPDGSPAQFKLVTQAEYDEILENEVPDVTSVTLDHTTLQLTIGEIKTLKAEVLPEAAAAKLKVEWLTSDPKVASVDAEGNVKAIGVGTANITAECSGKSAVCKVTVVPILAESVTLDKTEAEMDIETTLQLTATVLPANTTDKTLQWTSSDTALATVDANGLVTAISKGTVVITAKCGDASASCTIEITDPADGITDILGDNDQTYDVYNLQGIKVKSNARDLNALPAGIYIINGHLYMIP